MRKSTRGLLVALCLLSLSPVYAFSFVDPVSGIPGSPDLPDSPYLGDFLDSRSITFNVKKNFGVSSAGTYVVQVTPTSIVNVKGSATTKSFSPRDWDFQLLYRNPPSPRVGDYTFKMTAPLGGTFSNVLFATANTPPVIAGYQSGTFFMTEKRIDMNKDLSPEILWQRDDGHLGVWFMKNGINGTIMDTNLSIGIYLDSLYLATGHSTYEPDWRLICQADLDFNGMQDFVWQNTNSGKLRAWYLADTNFIDPSLTNLNYHSYSKPVIDSNINPNDFTITTNLVPTLITNYFTKTVTEIFTNSLSGPGFNVTTIVDDQIAGTTNILIHLFRTNITTFTVTNITSFTNDDASIFITNVVISTNITVTPVNSENIAITNVSVAEWSGRLVLITNAFVIPDLNTFTSTTILTPNIAGSGHSATTVFTYTNFPNIELYFTNSITTTYADVVSGFYLVTYTTNYNLSSITNFANPFVREVLLDDQSPTDGTTRLVAVADLDVDGKPDYIFRAADGTVFFEKFNETFSDAISQTNHIMNPAGNLEWNLVGVLDLNNDGWPDLLWQKKSNGATAVFFMFGVFDDDVGFYYRRLAKNSTGSLNGGAAMPVWKISGNADFNHDGQMDLLLRNTSTGQLIFWYLNGPKLGKSSTISGPVAGWQIVGPR